MSQRALYCGIVYHSDVLMMIALRYLRLCVCVRSASSSPVGTVYKATYIPFSDRHTCPIKETKRVPDYHHGVLFWSCGELLKDSYGS